MRRNHLFLMFLIIRKERLSTKHTIKFVTSKRKQMQLFIPQQMKIRQWIVSLPRFGKNLTSATKTCGTSETPGVHERGGQRHASQTHIYTHTHTHTHIILVYILGAHALCVGEMAWTNEAATRQVLSILPDTRSRQPTSKPVGVSRLRYALALFRAV